MKTVNVHEAKTTLSALLADVEKGEEVTIARNGVPVAKLVRVGKPPTREPGLLCNNPAWRNFTYNRAIFAPMSADELAEEGWE